MGEKYLTRHASAAGAAKAVSENPISAAIACISEVAGKAPPIQTPAGLPPFGPSENAAMRRTVGLMRVSGSVRCGSARQLGNELADDLLDFTIVCREVMRPRFLEL